MSNHKVNISLRDILYIIKNCNAFIDFEIGFWEYEIYIKSNGSINLTIHGPGVTLREKLSEDALALLLDQEGVEFELSITHEGEED